MLRSLVILILLPLCSFAQLYGTLKWTINGVQYNTYGQSETVWSDDGSYGVLVQNRLDENGDIRIFEYAKVTDSNFTRDSFKLNTAYTFAPLTAALIANGVASNAATVASWYSDSLSFDGYLNPDYGWSLVDCGDGTHGVENNGVYYRVPILGDYAVRKTQICVPGPYEDGHYPYWQSSADLLTDGHVSNNILLNANNEPYLQIVFQDSNLWNLRSCSDSGAYVSSTGINGHALGVGAITQTTNGTSVAWLLDHGMPDEFADPDDDGFQTLEEYITGTDPTNAASYFQIGISADGIQIPSISNRLYTIEGCDSLGVSNHWETVTNVFPNSGITITVPLDTNRFYRAHVSLP